MAIKIVKKTETVGNSKPEVASKEMYFKHEGSDCLMVVKKGESLSFLSNDIFDEVTKEEYLSSIKKEVKAPDVPVQSIAKPLKPDSTRTLKGVLKEMSGKEVFRTTYNSSGKPATCFQSEGPTTKGVLLLSQQNLSFTYLNSSGTKVVGCSHLEHGKVMENGVLFPAYDGHRVLYHW